MAKERIPRWQRETPHREGLCKILLERYLKEDRLIGAEVGVADGLTSKKLLDSFPNLFLLMVDSYLWGERSQRIWQEGLEHSKSFTDEFSNRRILMISPSIVGATVISDQSLDFAYIDANHTYKCCHEDLICWVPKVKIGGVLAGHDYGTKRDYNGRWGVKKAVDEFCEKSGFELKTEGGFLWSTIKTKLAWHEVDPLVEKGCG